MRQAKMCFHCWQFATARNSTNRFFLPTSRPWHQRWRSSSRLVKSHSGAKNNDGWSQSFSLFNFLFSFYRCDLKETFLLQFTENTFLSFSLLVYLVKYFLQVRLPGPRHHRDWYRTQAVTHKSTSIRRRSSHWSQSSWRLCEVCPTLTRNRLYFHMKR